MNERHYGDAIIIMTIMAVIIVLQHAWVCDYLVAFILIKLYR